MPENGVTRDCWMTAREEVEQRLKAKTLEQYLAFRTDFGGGHEPKEGQSRETWKADDIVGLEERLAGML